MATETFIPNLGRTIVLSGNISDLDTRNGEIKYAIIRDIPISDVFARTGHDLDCYISGICKSRVCLVAEERRSCPTKGYRTDAEGLERYSRWLLVLS